MSWANKYIDGLKKGQTVKFRPNGSSMSGKVESGQLVTVEPIADPQSLKVGDIVLCKVKGNQYLHMIMKIRGKNDKFEIGGYNRNFTNGWVGANQIFGKCVKIED
jgi:exosome complex RNA-binding protein Csl4